jgi:FtsP/CotA-like multicopper oxidase with cupredoxin domain
MLRLQLVLISTVAIAILTTVFAISSSFSIFSSNTKYDDSKRSVGSSGNNDRIKAATINTPHGVYQTTGDILDPTSQVMDDRNKIVIDPMKYLRTFNYGHISTLPNGTILREFTLIASDNKVMEISPGVFYNVWTFNGTVPGPTIRATEGDLVRINFINNGSKPHSLHTHGIHPAEMDGSLDMVGPHGGKFVYEFYAKPFGVFPYHCHMQPLEEHISHGLYGVYIVDPKKSRPIADEMVMMMNGYDTDNDKENNFYTVNGIPYYYMHHPIQIQKDKLIRVYLVNMLEFDPINNFHLHANMYQLYRSGTSLTPSEYTDMVTMSQGERGVLEFTYNYTGNYMFHAHKTEFAEKGWMGLFLVKDKSEFDKMVNDGSNNNFAQKNLVTTTKETLPEGQGGSSRN